MQKGRFRAQFGMSYVSLHTLPLYPTQRAKVEVPLHNQVAARDYQVVPALFATQIYVQVVIRQLATSPGWPSSLPHAISLEILERWAITSYFFLMTKTSSKYNATSYPQIEFPSSVTGFEEYGIVIFSCLPLCRVIGTMVEATS